ncbi:M48 family metallopeptidase [Marinimicrobium locisalis]|uniref:M48 family metallopeptidase n=1 Tax=Marinimicrobium locisalis TaxID=546022 RepID=UPI003221D38A
MTRPWCIEGDWYPLGESRRVKARLERGPLDRARLTKEEGEPVDVELSRLEVSPRLGNTPRYITFPDGAVLETSDNTAVDDMLRQRGGSRGGFVHWLENHRAAVLVAVFLTAAFVWGSVQFGVPAVANVIAHRLPADTLNQVSRETLTVLDRTHFDETGLSESRQAELRSTFEPLLKRYERLEGPEYRVLFRRGGESIGPNAMALPDGTLIFTDELIYLARNDNELLAILAHEVGHVEHRHSLRALIQTSLLGVGAMALLGDISGVAEVVATLPVVFASLSYSRDHELEADAFSARWLDREGIPREAFSSIMTRLRDWGQCRAVFEGAGVEMSLGEVSEARWRERCDTLSEEADKPSQGAGLSRYLSTHPATEDRLRRFEKHE